MKLEGILVSHVDDFEYSEIDDNKKKKIIMKIIMNTLMDKFKISANSEGSLYKFKWCTNTHCSAQRSTTL